MPAPTYLSLVEFPGDGTTTVWDFNFAGGYISRSHVKAWTRDANGIITDLTVVDGDFITDFRLTVTPAVPVGQTLRIYRETPRDEPIVNFTGGSNFTEANLDLLAKQAIFSAAEAFDAGQYASAEDLIGQANAAIAAASGLVAASAAAVAAQIAAAASASSAAGSAAVASAAAAAALAFSERTAALEEQIAAVAASFTYRGNWTTATAYSAGLIGSTTNRREIVRGPVGGAYENTGYVVMVNHTSGVFLDDVASGKLLNTDAAQLAITLSQYHLRGYGAVGDGVTNDTAAIALAAASGKRVYVPPGTYLHDTVTLGHGIEFYGPRSAVFKARTADKAHFLASGIAWFRIAGVTIEGHVESTGVTGVNDRGAVVVVNCQDFTIEDCKFTQHAGSGVTVSRQGLYVNHGIVRNNTFVKGGMPPGFPEYGTQDCAPVQVYQYAKNIEVYGNYATGPWYCAFLAQDQLSTGASRIYGLKVHSNKWVGMDNYGIVLYTLPSLVISSITDNGSGVFRVTTTAAHGLTGLDAVHLSACGTASGIWMPTVISPTSFDLAGSVFAAGALAGELRMSENCCGEFYDNDIDGIDGNREFAVSNKPYGAGLYIQGAGGIVAHGNVFRRTNLFTNSETLTPASIGVNQATGRIQVTGGAIYDSGYSGVSLKCTGGVGPIFVGGGLQIIRPVRDAIRVASGRNVTIDGVDILAGQATLSGRVRADTAGSQVSFRNITMREFIATAVSNAFDIADLTDFEVIGCRVKNYKPAAQSFEGLRLTNAAKGLVQGNYFDGGASTWNALKVTGVTDTLIQGNAWRMTPDGAARETVAMSGTCTGTIYTNDNLHFAGRMGNTSTGGAMHTRESSNLSGGKTRQQGDTITNTVTGVGAAAIWVKTAASAGGANWQALTLA